MPLLPDVRMKLELGLKNESNPKLVEPSVPCIKRVPLWNPEGMLMAAKPPGTVKLVPPLTQNPHHSYSNFWKKRRAPAWFWSDHDVFGVSSDLQYLMGI